jgi:hypothetical protein
VMFIQQTFNFIKKVRKVLNPKHKKETILWEVRIVLHASIVNIPAPVELLCQSYRQAISGDVHHPASRC